MGFPAKIPRNTFEEGFFWAIAISIGLFCLFTALILIGIF